MAGVPKYSRKASKQHSTTYSERMSQLELEDALRFLSRRKQEDAALGLDVPVASRDHVAAGYPGKFAASKPRLRCHGAAAMPPTPEAAQDLANGLIPPTVLWTPRRGAPEQVTDLSTFTSNRKQGKQAQRSAPAAPETTAAHVQPALRHDYSA